MTYIEEVTRDLRLRMLQLLACMPAYTGNEVVLQSELGARYAHVYGRDRVRTELTWLETQGLLVLQKPGGVYLATLTGTGLEVARGISHNPGVSHPGPGE